MDSDQPSRHKLNHSDVERNRRNKLKKEIDELKEVELLYDAGLNPVDKLSVLKCGVDIMRHITGKICDYLIKCIWLQLAFQLIIHFINKLYSSILNEVSLVMLWDKASFFIHTS